MQSRNSGDVCRGLWQSTNVFSWLFLIVQVSEWDVKPYYTIPYHTIPYHIIPFLTVQVNEWGVEPYFTTPYYSWLFWLSRSVRRLSWRRRRWSKRNGRRRTAHSDPWFTWSSSHQDGVRSSKPPTTETHMTWFYRWDRRLRYQYHNANCIHFFYRAMLCIGRTMLSKDLCLSVTHVASFIAMTLLVGSSDP